MHGSVIKHGKNESKLSLFSGHDTLIFGITSSKEVMSHFKGKDGGAILYKKFDDKRVVFDGDFKEVKTNF